MDEITAMKADIKNVSAWLKACIVNTPLVVKVNSAIQVNIGQGDGDTRWKGWAWKLLLFKFVIICIYIPSKYVIPCLLF